MSYQDWSAVFLFLLGMVQYVRGTWFAENTDDRIVTLSNAILLIVVSTSIGR